ncbi:MAG: efflux RND transporter periplasmic adaptor subunit [Armatimonadota bacterium]
MNIKKSVPGIAAAGIAVTAFAAGSIIRDTRAAAAEPDTSFGKASFSCPMHPAITSEKPDHCSACGMDLEAVSGAGTASIRLSDEETRLAGIRSEIVSKAGQGTSRIIPGRVQADDTRVYRINVPIDGWIQEITDTPVGAYVRKGELLAGYYSPELLARERAFFFALETADKIPQTVVPTQAGVGSSSQPGGATNAQINGLSPAARMDRFHDYKDEAFAMRKEFIRRSHGLPEAKPEKMAPDSNTSGHRAKPVEMDAKSAVQRNMSFATGVLGPEGNSGKINANQGILQGPVENLRNLGMSDDQIVHLAATREVTRTIDVFSPISGYLLSRSISKGQRFMEGTEFFQIADLSTVWVYAEVLDSDTQALKPGTTVMVRTADGKHQAEATVTNALPVADPSTRTSKIRLVVNNAAGAFTPGAAVDVILKVVHQPALSIPADALIDTGKATYVFIHGADGSYTRRDVVVERHSEGRIVIKSGLKSGERVVTAGNFLIDSESRLRSH